jgi:large subunit ribosomal protein L29
MAVGTKDLASENLRGFDDDRLVDELKKAKEELFNLRFQSATGQLDNHGRLRAVRKDMARIYTEMRERELGIGLPPAKQAAAAQAAVEASGKQAMADKKAKKGDQAKKDAKAEKKAEKAEKKAKTPSKDES